MNALGNKTWGEAYARVLVINADENIGVTGTLQNLCTGDGEVTPLLVASNMFGVSGTQKFFFGASDTYIKKLRTGVIEIGVPLKVVVRNVSLIQALETPKIDVASLFASEFNASTVNARSAVFAEGIEAASIDASVISASGATFHSVGASEVNSPVVNASDIRGTTVTASEVVTDRWEAAAIEACTITANNKVVTNNVSAASLSGCDNIMTWY